MKSLIFTLFIFNVFLHYAHAAHILEPIGTEIAATPPRGTFFLQGIYSYLRLNQEEKVEEHVFSPEVEFGMSERLQLTVEGEILIAEQENGRKQNDGIEELALGLKYRFFDETEFLPDMAIGGEFIAVSEFGEGHGAAVALILSKYLGRWFVFHVNLGYELQNVEDEPEELEEGVVQNTTDVELETDDQRGGGTKWTNTFFYNIALFFRAVPERLLIGTELNSGHDFIEDGITSNEVIVMPEFIAIPFDKPLISVKAGVPIGLTNDDDTVDWGISGGLSFQF